VHLHPPHLPANACLLSVVYTAALAVALTDPAQHALAGVVVVAGLVTRWAVRLRRPGIAPAPVEVAVSEASAGVDAVLPQERAVPPATATAA
jgi:hypothetical protein